MGGRSENPELWTFLESLPCGELLSGTVTAIERFGVFVALDDGPDHPVFPGVGFISVPELSWRRKQPPTWCTSDSGSRACSSSSTRGTSRPDCPCGRRSRTPSRHSPTASPLDKNCPDESPVCSRSVLSSR
ncbi:MULTISPECIES: S1 RNA-binding domain-containing protein [unclassified Streptomyces]|uniref:S1 RNA-binding domain-containing protein n=1 Tax=unclassified Streptomyces TaxID=2593676 RepID=UPI0036F55FF0